MPEFLNIPANRGEAVLRHYGIHINDIEDADTNPGLAMWHLLCDLLHFQARENLRRGEHNTVAQELGEAQDYFEEECEKGSYAK